MRRIPGVRDVWVDLGPESEPVLGAAVATDLTLEALKTDLRADTAAWKTPKRWAVLREFPVTARGKTDRTALRQAVFR